MRWSWTSGSVTEKIAITPFGSPGDADAFARLNFEWLEGLFGVENDDWRILLSPETAILAPGGHILVARRDDDAVGVCALIRIDQSAFELAKMAVDPHLRGQGIGRKLLAATIDHARNVSAEMLLITTNSKLASAIHLYEEAGFVPSDDTRHHRYGRSDVFLELKL